LYSQKSARSAILQYKISSSFEVCSQIAGLWTTQRFLMAARRSLSASPRSRRCYWKTAL